MVPPLHLSSNYSFEGLGGKRAYDYSRSGNPTRTVLEEQLAQLENAHRAFAFASGLAAISSVTRLLSAGDEILACDDLYGGTYRLFSKILNDAHLLAPKNGTATTVRDAVMIAEDAWTASRD